MYDIIVIGAGPAGLTAALYALRAGKKVLVIEKAGFGGQITYSPKIENYPGFKSMSGNEFADYLVDQVLAQGAETEFGEVTALSFKDGCWHVSAECGEYESLAVIVAVGVKHRRLWLDGEEELIGEGISFCAVCDGTFYRDKTVAVIGGGNSALQESILLSEGCKKVIIVQNLPYLTGEKRLADILTSRENVEIIYNTVVSAYLTDNNGNLTGLSLSGEAEGLDVDGVFLAIGLEPDNKIFSDIADLDSRGYFSADESCSTKSPGLFVAGDCRSKRVRQITTASSDGAVAAIAACTYIDSLKA